MTSLVGRPHTWNVNFSSTFSLWWSRMKTKQNNTTQNKPKTKQTNKTKPPVAAALNKWSANRPTSKGKHVFYLNATNLCPLYHETCAFGVFEHKIRKTTSTVQIKKMSVLFWGFGDIWRVHPTLATRLLWMPPMMIWSFLNPTEY